MRKIDVPENFERVQTGPIQFGYDHPGMFIRGDACIGLTLDLENAAELMENGFAKDRLRDLSDTMKQCLR